MRKRCRGVEHDREWLIDKRGERTQLDVAEKVGISRVHLANIEIGRRRPRVNVAKRIANELEFDWTLFFADEGFVMKDKSEVCTA